MVERCFLDWNRISFVFSTSLCLAYLGIFRLWLQQGTDANSYRLMTLKSYCLLKRKVQPEKVKEPLLGPPWDSCYDRDRSTLWLVYIWLTGLPKLRTWLLYPIVVVPFCVLSLFLVVRVQAHPLEVENGAQINDSTHGACKRRTYPAASCPKEVAQKLGAYSPSIPSTSVVAESRNNALEHLSMAII